MQDDEKVKKLIRYPKTDFSCDFSHYRPFVIRHGLRIPSEELQLKSFEDYSHHLLSHPEAVPNLVGTLIIHFARFFKHPLTFNFIESVILPEIIAMFWNNFPNNSSIPTQMTIERKIVSFETCKALK